MNPASHDSAKDRQLGAVLHTYLQAVDAGQVPDRAFTRRRRELPAAGQQSSPTRQVQQWTAEGRYVSGPEMVATCLAELFALP